MSSPYLGEIRVMSFGYAPKGWTMCNGQLLSIAQNAALFAILGTFYGGNGINNFALPNLQGRVPLHVGTGGGNTFVQGQSAGNESVTLSINQMPQHSHSAPASVSTATQVSPSNAYWSNSGLLEYATSPLDGTVAPAAIGIAGQSQPHENRAPFLVLNFCIALSGIFPSRN
jgi:microcystin-dependent protein